METGGICPFFPDSLLELRHLIFSCPDFHHRFPWSSGLQTWPGLHHGLYWGLQLANSRSWGFSAPYNLMSHLLIINLYVLISIAFVCSVLWRSLTNTHSPHLRLPDRVLTQFYKGSFPKQAACLNQNPPLESPSVHSPSSCLWGRAAASRS